LRGAPNCQCDPDRSWLRRHIDWSTWELSKSLWYTTRLPNVFDLARFRRDKASCEHDRCTRDSETST